MRNILLLSFLVSACGSAHPRNTTVANPVPPVADGPMAPDIRGLPGADGVDGLNGLAGEDGAKGEDGVDGVDGSPGVGFTVSVNSVVAASRDYGPSAWTNGELAVGAGIYRIPHNISTTVGAAGTGWLSVSVQDFQLCYQGVAPHSTVFTYKGVKSVGSDCHVGGWVNQGSIFLVTDESTLSVKIDGGGCGGGCVYTEVDFVVQGVSTTVGGV